MCHTDTPYLYLIMMVAVLRQDDELAATATSAGKRGRPFLLFVSLTRKKLQLVY